MEEKPHPQETGTMRATFAFNVLFSYYANINNQSNLVLQVQHF